MKCSKDQSNKISDISIRQSWHTFPVDPCEVGHDSNGISHSEFQVISFSRFSLEQNRINNLHFNSSVTQVMARMCAQSKSTKSTARICVRRPQFIAYLLYVSPYVCDLSVSWTRLFAILTGCMHLCVSRAQCGCMKQTLINFYYTLSLPCVLFTVQSHPFSSHCMCTQTHTSTPRMHWELRNTLTGHEWKSYIWVYSKNKGWWRFRGCRREWKEEKWKEESKAL